jgi:hypothetical protein
MTTTSTLTPREEAAIETIADRMMAGLLMPPGAFVEDEMEGTRNAFQGLLRLARLPIPEDAFLDELLLEMAEWHDRPTRRRAL